MVRINLQEFLLEATQRGVSDIYIVPGCPISIMIHGKTTRIGDMLMPDETERLVYELYRLGQRGKQERLFETGDDNFSVSLPGVSRFRVSMFRQRNTYGCIIRVIRFELPAPEELNIPPEVMNVSSLTDGLVLFAGASGSGKTTTMASVIKEINRSRTGELILTLENPLEYMHRHNRCIITQREIFTDTADYISGMKASMYQKPNVLLLSDVPDAETARMVIRMAQSGCLMMTALYGGNSVDALQNLLNLFPYSEQAVLCTQLASVLRAVVYQRMVPKVNGETMPVFETVYIDDTLRGLIRDGKLRELSGAIESSKMNEVIPFDRSLAALYRKQKISRETVIKYAMNKENAVRLVR